MTPPTTTVATAATLLAEYCNVAGTPDRERRLLEGILQIAHNEGHSAATEATLALLRDLNVQAANG